MITKTVAAIALTVALGAIAFPALAERASGRIDPPTGDPQITDAPQIYVCCIRYSCTASETPVCSGI